MSDQYFITHPDCAEPLTADEAQLVCIQPTNNGDLFEDIDLATQNPARVYQVSTLPGVVEALKLSLEIIDHANAGAWTNGNTDPSGSLDEGEVLTFQAVDRCRAALSAVHPAEGDKP